MFDHVVACANLTERPIIPNLEATESYVRSLHSGSCNCRGIGVSWPGNMVQKKFGKKWKCKREIENGNRSVGIGWARLWLYLCLDSLRKHSMPFGNIKVKGEN